MWSWTSGNSIIDEFIRDTQLNANENTNYLEWIEFDQFDLVENINKRGAFSSIYSAVWMEGPRWNLDEEAETWNRYGPIKVIAVLLYYPFAYNSGKSHNNCRTNNLTKIHS
ncbi:hypothetical protein RhiirA5_379644 [Rhizophagus irregularis]|uniref:Uncharacterized protein n=1 Tax=Rhizophagus irregularis TaxID=588596 RepID=A0A2N0PBB7_9GLOM|nr:hypothetical protein RhiirA5_379644 [Rhizophagus irregularis]